MKRCFHKKGSQALCVTKSWINTFLGTPVLFCYSIKVTLRPLFTSVYSLNPDVFLTFPHSMSVEIEPRPLIRTQDCHSVTLPTQSWYSAVVLIDLFLMLPNNKYSTVFCLSLDNMNYMALVVPWLFPTSLISSITNKSYNSDLF